MKNKTISPGSTPLRTCKSCSQIFNNKWFIFLLLVVFAAGCKKVIEEQGFIGICPTVISTNPADTATGVNLNTTIAATFNEVMDASTINTLTFTLTKGATPIAGAITYAGTTATFSPTTATADGTAVTMTISNTAGLTPGSYTVTVSGTSGAITNSTDVVLNVFSGTINAATLLTPANGATGVAADGTLTWTEDPNADSYLVEVATDAAFTNVVNTAMVTEAMYMTSLAPNTLYYWRVTSSNQCATAASSAVRTFTTANISCAMFTATDTPIALPASGVNTRNSIITVVQDFPITDVNVRINIAHTYDSDLDISLISPAGTVIDLSSANGGSGDNFTNTFFDQDATTLITAGAPPFTGSFQPEGNLSSLNGQMSAGNWTLRVVDNFNLDGGSINEFRLDLCVQGTLGVEEYQFSDFLIFPNPNNGEFTIKLNSSSSSNIKVEVYDVRGRSIFNTVYSNTSEFNQTISLNNAQSGMYLVKVSDGERQTTKKIIVK